MKVYTSSIKYIGLMLCLFVLTAQIYCIWEDLSEKNNTAVVITEEDCETSYYGLTVTMLKCSVAFLLGGMFSDFKFTKFGVI